VKTNLRMIVAGLTTASRTSSTDQQLVQFVFVRTKDTIQVNLT